MYDDNRFETGKNPYENTENTENTFVTPVYSQPAEPVKPAKPPKKEKSGVGKIIIIALCCSLVGAILGSILTMAIGGGVKAFNGSTDISEGQRNEVEVNINKVETGKVLTAAEIYAANVNATVGITSTSVTTNFFGYPTTSAASGSGFILTADGYVVTNHHVIADATSVKVATYSGESYEATVVGYDQSNDLAVLKIDAKNLSHVIVGDSDKMNVGDDVVAIGNPLGELTFSLTSGAISALNREVTMSNGISMDLIQTDCAINSGNSGGALFNMYGEVIGITNAKYSTSSSSGASIDNIGFAIPMNNVKDLITGLIENGYISKAYIGVSIEDVDEKNQEYGLPAGAAVAAVTENGPAAKAGVKAKDIITKVNGQEIKSSTELKRIVSASKGGDKLNLTIYRQGQTLEITVTVEEQKQSAAAQQEQQEQEGSTFNPFENFDPFEHFFG